MRRNPTALIMVIMLMLILAAIPLFAENDSSERSRKDGISEYGTFAVVQKPIEGVGQAIDWTVKGIGKAGSYVFTLPFRPFMKEKNQTGETHG
ncbi:MAG: hypothetical protein COV74_01635 [Candidatus Omnitrophica bacterium CG11_big_fil_rev_8_21_14_0_20_45_26]|uniref:Uncharacterized protein n=1 Tax=Candidatus Abzuiibacterium crystallinum TaxID=1974748 RepID=A0A2H0LS49_9BACT|nr:MAG: hypothetical protein COV74_01635 [Candidatus Omnitrophica bacterium CG11_big_fil_rev_8_21_14_0_20_45_26]PIW64998.1 MAG: hypothetical protein COW12_03915 [Candidatus Omnitrophica bacterium CG12_big_fil_rev_8_21_14_0_65_45_16]